ncbi:hypothetical protein GTY65_24440 [Streptomyces sp. SID8379]|uniref:hypothetical protein n=1 Tax=unclassified Streptomyces TaxID=2593676 RepID=UPI0003740C1F|nr:MULTISPECIES: hypothetical protein [unclassified Streptomyces]MYW67192.1 hypothetical protein [Streptomyces sp. SID8379]
MQPHVIQALHDWRGAWTVHERAAQAAFTTAFPALNVSDPRCYCFGPTLRYSTPGEGEGKVCLDDHGRATFECEKVPVSAVAAAMLEVWGVDWFGEGPAGFGEAPPGAYHYEDEQTYAEYEITVHDDGTADVSIAYVKVDDVVTILDALERALDVLRPA